MAEILPQQRYNKIAGDEERSGSRHVTAADADDDKEVS